MSILDGGDDVLGWPTSRYEDPTLLELAREEVERSGGTVGAALDAASSIIDGIERFAESGDPDGAAVALSVPENFRMYSFVEVTPPDPRDVARRHAQEKPLVRRPLLGLTSYEDRYATLEVLVTTGDASQGEAVEIYNSTYSQGRAGVTTNFIVTSVVQQPTEAAQVVKTFGDWYLADVGEEPLVLQVQGTLFESKNFPWLSEWKRNWDRYLRARQCILRKAQVYLTVDDTMYVGYMLNSTWSRSASQPWTLVPFSFTMILRKEVDVRSVNLFPEIVQEGTSNFTLRDLGGEGNPNGGTFVDGIRVNAPLGGAGEGSSSVVSLPDSPDPDYSPVSALEIVSPDTSSMEGVPSFRKNSLPDVKGRKEDALVRNSLEQIEAVARAINASMGRDVFDIQRVRNGYMNNFQAELVGLGIYDAADPSKFGLPTLYQSAVDSQRRRVGEDTRRALGDAYSRAEDFVSGIEWL